MKRRNCVRLDGLGITVAGLNCQMDQVWQLLRHFPTIFFSFFGVGEHSSPQKTNKQGFSSFHCYSLIMNEICACCHKTLSQAEIKRHFFLLLLSFSCANKPNCLLQVREVQGEGVLFSRLPDTRLEDE